MVWRAGVSAADDLFVGLRLRASTNAPPWNKVRHGCPCGQSEHEHRQPVERSKSRGLQSYIDNCTPSVSRRCYVPGSCAMMPPISLHARFKLEGLQARLRYRKTKQPNPFSSTTRLTIDTFMCGPCCSFGYSGSCHRWGSIGLVVAVAALKYICC